MQQLNGNRPIKGFTGIKVFSATQMKQRDALGDIITDWIRETGNEIVDVVVTQSSDSEFHCVTLTVFYSHRAR